MRTTTTTTTPTTPTSAAPAAMIDRVASVLEAFDCERSLSLAEISRRAALPRSSAHRILQRLVVFGLVERDGNGYGLGLRMFELGTQMLRGSRFLRSAPPVLADLHRATGLAVHLSVLDGTEVVHLDQLAGAGLPAADWAAGTRSEAVHTAPGRALLARLPVEQWSSLVVHPRGGAHGIRSWEHLSRELLRIRERDGVAVDVHGSVPGVAVLAVPVGPTETVTALSVSGPVELVRPDRLTGPLRTAAGDIWAATIGIGRPVRRQVHPYAVARAGSA